MVTCRNTHNIWVKAIAMVVLCLFLVNDIAWAHPESFNSPSRNSPPVRAWSFNLSVQSIFDPLQTKQIRDMDVIKYYILCLAKASSRLNLISSDVNAKTGIENAGLSLEFSRMNEQRFARLLRGQKDSYIIPCKINESIYYAYITLSANAGSTAITVFTEKEFKKIKEKGIIAHNAKTLHGERSISGGEKGDTLLPAAHSDKASIREISNKLNKKPHTGERSFLASFKNKLVSILRARYPLSMAEKREKIQHEERQANIESIKKATGYENGVIEDAYDAMVSDIANRAKGGLFDKKTRLSIFILKEEDEPIFLFLGDMRFVIKSVEQNAFMRIVIIGDDLFVKKNGEMEKHYKLIFRRGDYSEILVDVGDGHLENINVMFCKEAGIELKGGISEVIKDLEISGVAIYNPKNSVSMLYRYAAHNKCYLSHDGIGMKWISDHDTIAVKPPLTNKNAICKYGKLLFIYHYHPPDIEGNDELSTGDRELLKAVCDEFNKPIPSIIWLKEGDNKLRAHMWVPIGENNTYPARPKLARYFVKHRNSISLGSCLLMFVSLGIFYLNNAGNPLRISSFTGSVFSIIISLGYIGGIILTIVNIYYYFSTPRHPSYNEAYSDKDLKETLLSATILPDKIQFNNSHPKAGGSPADYLTALGEKPELQKSHTINDYKEIVKPGVSDATIRRDRSKLVERGYLKKGRYKHRKGYEYKLTDEGRARSELINGIKNDVQHTTRELVSAICSLAISPENDEKILLALDEDLGRDGTINLIRQIIKDIYGIKGSEKLRKILQNLIIIKGRGKILADAVSRYTGKGRDGAVVKKSNVVMVTKASNEENCEEFENEAIITFVDDSKLGMMDYYPFAEVTLFTLAKALYAKGIPAYNADKLVCLYKSLNIVHTADDQVISICIDNKVARIVLLPAKQFYYDELQCVYHSIREFLQAA